MSRNHTCSQKIRKASSSVNPTLNNLKNHQILMFRIRFPPLENDHPTWNQPDSMWCSKHPFPNTHQIIVRCSFSYCTRPVDEQIPSAPKRLGSSCGKLCRKLAMAPTWFHPKMVGESCYPIYLLGEYNLYNQYIYILCVYIYVYQYKIIYPFWGE